MPTKSKKITMHDVAERAGVSYQTVSRVLNNSCNVSQATREKIEQAIADLKYVPNLLAQQLSKHERMLIGLVNVTYNLSAPGDVVNRVRFYALRHNYELLITLIEENTLDQMEHAITRLKAQMVDKLLINVPLSNDIASKLVRDNPDCTLVFLDVDPFCPVLNVCFNPYDGTIASIIHLSDLGHRKIALIPGPENIVSSELRHNSWLDGLKSHGMTAVACVHGDWSSKSGYDAMMKILHQTREFSAVLVGNDQMALGAMNALNVCGLRVPQDISVVGYDNTRDSAYFCPPLTTVDLDRDLQCRIAVEKLVNGQGDSVSSVLPTSLITRQSCARVTHDQYSLSDVAASLHEIARKLEHIPSN